MKRWMLEVPLVGFIITVWVIFLLSTSLPVSIFILFIIAVFGLELTIALRHLAHGNWKATIDQSLFHASSLKLSIEAAVSLEGTLYTPFREHARGSESLPVIVFAPGMVGSVEVGPWIMLPLVKVGYAVLTYKPRGHGKSEGNRSDTIHIVQDIKKVIDYIATKPELDINRCGVIGHSLGGVSALTHAYNDPRVKSVIAIAAPHDLKLFCEEKKTFSQKLKLFGFKLIGFKTKWTLEENRLVSPKHFLQETQENKNRVFLIHAKDDFVNYQTQFLANAMAAELPKENTLLFQKGGHELRGQETVATAQIIRWFEDTLGKAKTG